MLFAALAGDASIAWMSDSARELLGREPEALVGTSAIDLLHPDDHEIVIETFAESIRGAEDRPRVALRVAHADGRWLSLEFGGMDLRDESGSGSFLVWGSSNESTGPLLHLFNSMLAGEDLSSLLEQVVVWHDRTSAGTRAAVLVRDRDGVFRCQARAAGLPDVLVADVDPNAVVDAPAAVAADRQEMVEHPDLTGLPPALAEGAADAGLEAVWAVPVLAPGATSSEAVLLLWRERAGTALATQRRQITNTVQVLRLTLEWAVTREALVTAATTDLLTGLANRAQLDARIRADRSNLAAVLFCDLDDFKRINDRYGHLVGDRILRESARRMADAVRPSDLLVRLGGDEFAVWCPELTSAQDAERVAERLISVLDVTIEIDGHAHRIGCSVGVAVTAAGDTLVGDVDRLLSAADHALYRAKDAGKGRWAAAYDTTEPLPFPED